jgi:GTP:adenosylcobinamide-phosphate guanylyltransferase
MGKIMGLIMAGGRGGRLKMHVEKPMLKVNGIPLIKRAVDACLESRCIQKVYVAVSQNTLETAGYLTSLAIPSVEVIQTPGVGYHDDMKTAIRAIGTDNRFIVMAADIPSLKAGTIDKIAMRFIESGKPALAVFAPKGLFERVGLKPTTIIKVDGEECVPCGINAIDGSYIDEEGYLDEVAMVIRDPDVCMNINTRTDLRAYRKGQGERLKKGR